MTTADNRVLNPPDFPDIAPAAPSVSLPSPNGGTVIPLPPGQTGAAAAPAAPPPPFEPRAELTKMLQAGKPKLTRDPYETPADFSKRQADALKEWTDRATQLRSAMTAIPQADEAAARAKATQASLAQVIRGKKAEADLKQAQVDALQRYAPLRDKKLLADIQHTKNADDLARVKQRADVQLQQSRLSLSERRANDRDLREALKFTLSKDFRSLDPAARAPYLLEVQKTAEKAGRPIPAASLKALQQTAVQGATANAKMTGGDAALFKAGLQILTRRKNVGGIDVGPMFDEGRRREAAATLKKIMQRTGGDVASIDSLTGLGATPAPATAAPGAAGKPAPGSPEWQAKMRAMGHASGMQQSAPAPPAARGGSGPPLTAGERQHVAAVINSGQFDAWMNSPALQQNPALRQKAKAAYRDLMHGHEWAGGR